MTATRQQSQARMNDSPFHTPRGSESTRTNARTGSG